MPAPLHLGLIPTAKLFPTLRSRPPDQVDDFCVMRDGERIGRMYRHHGGPRSGQWSWFLRIEGVPTSRLETGTEDTLELAKVAFKAAINPADPAHH